MKNKGFTLVELIAVLTILSIILLIVIPTLLKAQRNSVINTKKSSVHNIIKIADMYYTNHVYDNIEYEKNILGLLKLDGERPDDGHVFINKDGDIQVALLYDGICFTKDYTEEEITVQDNNTLCMSPLEPGVDGANVPNLVYNLVPVELSTGGNITVADATNTDWYNYDDNIWANAVVIKGDTPAVGEEISMEDVIQMYVWIPRYKFSNITESNKPITIEFVDNEITEGVHPAFRLDNGDGTFKDISGIWVSKFEITQEKDGDMYKIIPNARPLAMKSISEFYNIINGFNTNGSDSVHMIKNTEWGAAAYLSQSKYGLCTDIKCTAKVQNNNYYQSTNTLTGCGGKDDWIQDTCPSKNEWNTSNGIKASTTYNITGIYDMAAGLNEFVMACTYKSSQNVNLDTGNTGFTQSFLDSMPLKNIDRYPYGTSTSDTDRYISGDATVETKEWNSDYDMFPYRYAPWFTRGGDGSESYHAGIFAYSYESGEAYSNYTTRAAIFGN